MKLFLIAVVGLLLSTPAFAQSKDVPSYDFTYVPRNERVDQDRFLPRNIWEEDELKLELPVWNGWTMKGRRARKPMAPMPRGASGSDGDTIVIEKTCRTDWSRIWVCKR